MRIWSFALVAAAIAATLGAMNVQRAFAAEEIGSVRTVLVYAYGTPPVTARRPL